MIVLVSLDLRKWLRWCLPQHREEAKLWTTSLRSNQSSLHRCSSTSVQGPGWMEKVSVSYNNDGDWGVVSLITNLSMTTVCSRPGSLQPQSVAGLPHMSLALYVVVTACSSPRVWIEVVILAIYFDSLMITVPFWHSCSFHSLCRSRPQASFSQVLSTAGCDITRLVYS